MASSEMKMPISRAMSFLVINVKLTGVRGWRVRVWLGLKLMTLAARVIGCGIHIEGPS